MLKYLSQNSFIHGCGFLLLALTSLAVGTMFMIDGIREGRKPIPVPGQVWIWHTKTSDGRNITFRVAIMEQKGGAYGTTVFCRHIGENGYSATFERDATSKFRVYYTPTGEIVDLTHFKDGV